MRNVDAGRRAVMVLGSDAGSRVEEAECNRCDRTALTIRALWCCRPIDPNRGRGRPRLDAYDDPADSIVLPLPPAPTSTSGSPAVRLQRSRALDGTHGSDHPARTACPEHVGATPRGPSAQHCLVTIPKGPPAENWAIPTIARRPSH